MKKNSAFCSVLQGHTTIVSPKERLYEQMTSNPAFTERNIQKTNAVISPIFLSRAKIFGHVSHSAQLVRMCLACQQFDFNSADWICNNLVRFPAVICEQWKRTLSFSSADVRGAGTRDAPLRMFAGEAIPSVTFSSVFNFSHVKVLFKK